MFKLIIFIIITILTICNCNAQVQYSLIMDKNASSITGACDLVTIHKGISSIENKYLKPTLFDENSSKKKCLGITYRLGKFILLDNTIDHLIFVSQHEVFGHGARLRELGFSNIVYAIGLPFPYGHGGGFTTLSDTIQPSGKTLLPVLSAGAEANTVFSNQLSYKWMLGGTINYRDVMLYMRTFHNTTLQMLDSDRPGSDYTIYINTLNYTEQNNTGKSYTKNYLTKFAAINFLNPFQYIAARNFFKTYLIKGESNSSFSGIKIRNYNYLPAFRAGLTPFGAEVYFENFLFDQKVFRIYYRQGDQFFHRFYGMGFTAINLINNKFLMINANADAWNQPFLNFNKNVLLSYGSNTFGGLIAGTVFFKLLKKPCPLNIMFQIGYKSVGYLEGEQLKDGLIFRAGISFQEKK